MIQKTLQIATFGSDKKGILSGIHNFPIHKLILLHYKEDTKASEEFAGSIHSTIGIPISLKVVAQPDIIRSSIEQISCTIKDEGSNYDQILINVSAGDKMMCYAAVSGAFVNGIKAFDTNTTGNLVILPMLKLSPNEIISDAKIKILHILDSIGGAIESLENLSKYSGFGKSLLSYHVNGTADSKGLVQLGLVDVERLERGRTRIMINTFGKMVIST